MLYQLKRSKLIDQKNMTMNNNSTRWIARMIEPFQFTAQMNNIGVLIVAYVAYSINQETKCSDPLIYTYLNFVLYGSTLVCGGTLILTLLYWLGLIDFCLNSIIPCGEVCLALNTLGIFLVGILYHFVATCIGFYQFLFGSRSQCIQLEMFKSITSTIYGIWFIGIVIFVTFTVYREKTRTNLSILHQHMINA